jgi:hypothetical protein
MIMREKSFLLAHIGTASFIETVGLFTLVLMNVHFRLASTSVSEGLVGATSVCIPCAIAVWWLFRKLQSRYSKREVKAVATAFGVFSPISLAVSLLLAQIGGSYVGSVIATFVIDTLLSFAVCLFVLRMTRHIEKTQTVL